jgi:hypothetical protein
MAGLKFSDAEIERRRTLAREMHAQKVVDPETGLERPKFGGAQPRSGRPRVPRASEAVAEEIRKNAKLVASAIVDNLTNESAGIRLQAARLAMEIEHKEAELQLKEERAFESMETSELVKYIIDASMKTKTSGALEGLIVDGTATDVTDESAAA